MNETIDNVVDSYVPPFTGEHPYYKGYYQVPVGQSHVVINKRGELINLITGEKHFTRIAGRGYVITTLCDDGIWKNYLVHRLVALLFVDKPERHKEISFDELQVNHIDGDKLNNVWDNLEWVTGEENMKHAREHGLFSNQLKVLSKDVETGEMESYYSVSECARKAGVTQSVMFIHLWSVAAGRIKHLGRVYKFDDGKPWPEFLAPDDSEEYTLGRVCDIVGENIETGERTLFCSVKHACRLLKLDIVGYRNHKARKGAATPYKGWLFSPLTE
jgi:hypothetical protein